MEERISLPISGPMHNQITEEMANGVSFWFASFPDR